MNDDYLAGFIDGEGCLTLNKVVRVNRVGRQYYRAILHIGSTNRDILEYIQDYLGGGFIALMNKNDGKRKQAYQYVITGSALLPILMRLRGRLLVKNKQAEVLISFLEGTVPHGKRHTLLSRTETNRRDKLIEQIRRLNKRGL